MCFGFQGKREKTDPDVVESFGKAKVSHLLFLFLETHILITKTQKLLVIFAVMKLVFPL